MLLHLFTWSSLPMMPSTEADTAVWVDDLVNRKGYVVVPGVLSAEQVSKARQAVMKRARSTAWEPSWVGRRKRVTEIIEFSSVFADMLADAPFLPAFQRICGDLLLGSYHSLVLYNGSHKDTPVEPDRAMRLRGMHTDFPYGARQGRKPLREGDPWTCQALWMLDDMDAANGGTYVVPYSQQLRRGCQSAFANGSADDDEEFESQGVTVTGKAGDVLLYVGQLWHQSGINTVQRPRCVVLGQFLPYYFAPMEAHAWTTPKSVVAGLPAKVKQLMGFGFRHPQRFGGRRRGLLQGTRFALEAAADVLLDHTAAADGPASCRTESPSNSMRSTVYWRRLVCSVFMLLATVGLCVWWLSGPNTVMGSLAVVFGIWAALAIAVLLGFVLGSLATLQHLWF
eukprot:m.156014 g.156014  ORF g.156014 m.156014 type:complete len:396 (+) comp17552_c0_seq2:43-1230(+)